MELNLLSSSKSKLTLGCLNDIETGEDSLGFKPYVEAIAEFLTAEGTLPPITLSIEGQWGCGKSSFMRQLQKEISKKNKAGEEPKYFTVWFNSWKYDKEDELWASFALNFMDELSKQISWRRLQFSRLKLLLLRYKIKLKSNFLIFVHFLWSISSLILISSLLSLVIIYVLHYLGMALPYFITENFFQKFANFILISAPLAGLMKYCSTEKWFIDICRDPFGLKKLESNTNYKEHLSFREYFHSDLNEIIKSYVGDSKVYVFIDDLDRCEVPKAAELMQAINLMISDNSKVYFSLAVNRKIISAGLAAKNKKVIDYLEVEGLEYGYDFIEKFIQLPFKVPSPKSADFLKFLTSVNEISLNPSEPSENFTHDESPEGDIRSLKNESRIQNTGSNDLNNVETESNKQEIHNDKDCVENSEISKLILEMVSPALDNNPRRIKQFINQFRFQKIIGYRIGLFSYNEGTLAENMWNCKKLAKFVAISIKWNSLISALNSNRRLLDQLQEYALKPENERNKLERWTKEEKLIELLRHGCMKGTNISENMAEYTLSGLDLSNLLEISPVITYTEEANFVGSDFKGTNFYWSKMKKSILIPIIFTEGTNRSISYNMYEKFIRLDKKLNSEPYLLKKIPDLKFPLVIDLQNFNPRNSYNSEDWILAWDELLKNWDGMDKKLIERLPPNEGFCYHIYPHLVLPLAFALGASVNLRRPLVLYHYQNQEKFYKVIDLKDPREVSHKPKSAVAAPKTIPEDLDFDNGKKLILHIVISARHVENFQLHEDYLNATNVAIVYDRDLDPKEDWLPYVQEIVQIAKPLIHRYEDVDVCLICPSVVAFALGMAFSRKGSLKVCHYFSDGKYRPVFPLSEIESHLPFS